MLQDLSDNFRTCADRKIAQLFERFFSTELWLGTRTGRCGSVASSLHAARESLLSTQGTVIQSNQERTFLAHTGREGAAISSWLQQTGAHTRTTALPLGSRPAQFRTTQSHLSFGARGGGSLP